MNHKLSILLAASAFALAACNSPTDEGVNQAAVDAEVAGEPAMAAAEPVDEAGLAGTDAAVAVDTAADPIQQAYEEGKADAAVAVGDASANVEAEMEQEAAEAEAAADAELQD